MLLSTPNATVIYSAGPLDTALGAITVNPRNPDPTAVLKRAGIFANLTEKELNFLASRALPRRYGAGQLIFSEGDPCEGLYVIVEGRIKVFETSANGREQVLRIIGPGSSLGETPVFDGGNHPTSAAAVDDLKLVLIRTKDFRSVCLQHPAVVLKVLKEIASRLRLAYGTIEGLSFSTVRQRLATLLLRTAKRRGRPTPRGVEFKLHATNLELAAQIGTVRELVSRNLGCLQAEGVIRLQGRNVIVPDLKKLQSKSTDTFTDGAFSAAESTPAKMSSPPEPPTRHSKVTFRRVLAPSQNRSD